MLPQKIDKIEVIDETIHNNFIKNIKRNPSVPLPFEFWSQNWFFSSTVYKIVELFRGKAEVRIHLQDKTIQKPSKLWKKRILLYTKNSPVSSIYITLLYNDMFWNFFHKIEELELITFEIRNNVIWLKWNWNKNLEMTASVEALLRAHFSYFFVLLNSVFEILNIFLQLSKLAKLKIWESMILENWIETLKQYILTDKKALVNADIIDDIKKYRNKFGHKQIWT